MGNDDAPDRRGRIQDRGEAARDMSSAPAEQGERQRIVKHGEQHDRTPCFARQVNALTLEAEKQPHRPGGDRQTQPDISQRRHVLHGYADEEEGSAPDERENAQD